MSVLYFYNVLKHCFIIFEEFEETRFTNDSLPLLNTEAMRILRVFVCACVRLLLERF